MKGLSKLIILIGFLMCSLQEGYAQTRDTIVIHDTIYLEKPKLSKKVETVESNNLIRIKPMGRYDRGIVNYKFIPKGKWIGGLTFSYVNFDSDDSSLLYSLLGGMDMNLGIEGDSSLCGVYHKRQLGSRCKVRL